MSTRTRWWHLVHDEEGLGLAEMLVALFILSVALLALASVATTTLVQLRVTRDREQATNAGSAALEQVRARDYRAIAHDPGEDLDGLPADVADRLGVSTATCADGEPLIHDGNVDNPVPMHRVDGHQDRIDVYTVVTWAEGDCATVPEATGLKRVVALARWDDAGTIYWSRQETLVTEAGRGLPVPNFQVRPDEASLQMAPEQADASNFRRCVEHQLRNLGADDRYEWKLDNYTGKSGAPFRATADSYATQDGKWAIYGYLEYPEEESRGGAPPPDDARMTTIDGGDHLASDVVVPSGETASLTFCYEPDDRAAGDFTTNIQVFSRFDDRKVADVTHHVRIADPGEELFLLSRIDDERHPRAVGGEIPPSIMRGDLDPTAEDSWQRLGTIDYTQTALSNWSTDIGVGDDLAGVRLVRSGDDDVRTADWRHQFPIATDLLRNPTLTIWTAPVSALDGSLPATTLVESDEEDGEDEVVPVTVRQRFELILDGLSGDEDVDELIWPGVVTTTAIDYEHSESGWQQHTVVIPTPDMVTFDPDQRLRLRVRCHEDSEEDCNVAFDNVDHPAAMTVRLVE
jgi:competence protein ComGC